MNFEASATSSLPEISKLAKAFDNFEVWVLMSLAHRRGLWPLASCSALRSQASGSCAGPLLPNKSAAKYRPREASAKLAPAGRPMSIFYWFFTGQSSPPMQKPSMKSQFLRAAWLRGVEGGGAKRALGRPTETLEQII